MFTGYLCSKSCNANYLLIQRFNVVLLSNKRFIKRSNNYKKINRIIIQYSGGCR